MAAPEEAPAEDASENKTKPNKTKQNKVLRTPADVGAQEGLGLTLLTPGPTEFFGSDARVEPKKSTCLSFTASQGKLEIPEV